MKENREKKYLQVNATLGHLKEHLRSKTRDDEIPEPIIRRSTSLCERSYTLVKGLAIDYPRRSVPSWCVEGGPKIEEEDCRNTSAGERCVAGIDARNVDVSAEIPHAQRAAERANEKEGTAADAINQPQQPNDGDGSFHNAKDAGGKETVAGSFDANAFKHSW